MLHGSLVRVRRVIHVVVHYGLTDVVGVLRCTHFFVDICHSHLFVNFCIRRYCIYRECEEKGLVGRYLRSYGIHSLDAFSG